MIIDTLLIEPPEEYFASFIDEHMMHQDRRETWDGIIPMNYNVLGYYLNDLQEE